MFWYKMLLLREVSEAVISRYRQQNSFFTTIPHLETYL